jgi:hypothetical protein
MFLGECWSKNFEPMSSSGCGQRADMMVVNQFLDGRQTGRGYGRSVGARRKGDDPSSRGKSAEESGK